MSSAVVAFHRLSLLTGSAVLIVTACAACTIAVKPQDKSKDEAPPTPPVAAAPPPVIAAPPPVTVAAAAPVAAPVQRPAAPPVAAAPIARAPNSKGVGESCTVNSHTECRIGLFCEAHGVCKVPPSATRTSSSPKFASGHACGLDSLCASGVCLPTPGSAFGKCK